METTTTTKRTARVLVRREKASEGEPWYVAQVLEYDIATQARSADDLIYELQRIIVAHILCCEQEQIDPFAVKSAPAEYEAEYRALRSTLTVDITRARADSPMKHSLPLLSVRFAAGA